MSSDYSGAFYLTNTSQGDALNATLKFELPYGQQPIWGVAAYTWGESNVVNDGTSSRAVSNWQYTPAPDPNNMPLSRSFFEVAHRVMINLNYEFNRQSRWSTVVSAFFNHSAGRPWHTVMGAGFPFISVNEDGWTNNDLIYVPTGPDDVVITNGTWEQLETYIERAGLSSYAGGIAPRTAYSSPYITQTDLAIRQNIPLPGRHSLQLSFDIFNFWNLIDNESGHVKYAQFGRVFAVEYQGTSEEGLPIYELERVVTDPENNDIYETDFLRSRWRLRFGARWSF